MLGQRLRVGGAHGHLPLAEREARQGQRDQRRRQRDPDQRPQEVARAPLQSDLVSLTGGLLRPAGLPLGQAGVQERALLGVQRQAALGRPAGELLQPRAPGQEAGLVPSVGPLRRGGGQAPV